MAAFALAARPQVILFDVNETLLDMSPLRKAMTAAFGTSSAFRQWFRPLLQYSLVDTVTQQYHAFNVIGDAALDMTARMLQKKPLSLRQKRQILAHLTRLPPHPDVPRGLAQLLEAGYTLVAFTNPPQPVLDAQLRYAELMHFFEQGLSVDAVHRYKPHLYTYRSAAQYLGVAPADALLVAAHGWDVAGAQRAGLQAAFIARPGQTLYPLAPLPTLQAQTLLDLAQQLTE